MVKYKPCCNKRCLLGDCKTREAGGCYCICRLVDHVKSLERTIEGDEFLDGTGFLYIPNPQIRKEYIASLSQERQNEFEKNKLKAVEELKLAKEKLKEYEEK